MNEFLFEEKQRFSNSILILIPLAILLIFLYGFYRQFILKIPFGNHPMSDFGYIIFLTMYTIFLIFILCIYLETKIDKEGIYFRFFPIQFQFIIIKWDDILKIELVTYKPILEYGGWGYRGMSYSQKRALNISGNKGIKIYFNDGKSLLIGTQKKEEISIILSKIEKINSKFFN